MLSTNNSWEGAEKRGRLFSEMQSERQKAEDMSCNLGKILTHSEKKAFTLGRSESGTGSPESWWKLHPWRYTKLTRMRPALTGTGKEEGTLETGLQLKS